MTVDGRDGRGRAARAPAIRRRGSCARRRGRRRSACAGSRSASTRGQTYEAERATLEPGDAVVLYTDGVVEARRDGELYGDERLDALLAEHAGLPAQELADAARRGLPRLCGGELRGRLRGRRPQAHVIELAPARRPAALRIGHRGAAALAPENTLEAIEARGRARLRPGRVRRPRARRRAGGRARPACGPADGPADPRRRARPVALGGQRRPPRPEGAAAPSSPVAEALRRHGLVERTIVSSFRPHRRCGRCTRSSPGCGWARTYPQDRTGPDQAADLPAAGAGDRARPPPGAAAQDRRAPRRLPRDRRRPLLGGASARRRWPAATRSARRCSSGRLTTRALLPWLDEIGVDGVITNDPRIFRD